MAHKLMSCETPMVSNRHTSHQHCRLPKTRAFLSQREERIALEQTLRKRLQRIEEGSTMKLSKTLRLKKAIIQALTRQN